MNRALRVLIPWGAALALAACNPTAPNADSTVTATPLEPAPAAAEEPIPQPPAVAPTNAAAGPAGVDTMTWIYDKQGKNGRPRLSYVTPQGNDTVLRLECEIGGAVYAHLERPAPADGSKPENWPFALISTDTPSKSSGSVVAKEGGLTVIGAFPITTAALRGFRDSRTLAVTDATLPTPLPVDIVDDSERVMVSRFFRACEGK